MNKASAMPNLPHTKKIPILASPWVFVPVLFIAFGLGSIGIMGSMASIMYKGLGYSNAFIGMLSLLSLPGSFIFLLTPFLDSWSSKRALIWKIMASLAATLLLLAAVTYFQTWFTPLSVGLFLLMSFFLACQGTAGNGFYQRSLSLKEQAKFTGIITASIRAGGLIGLAFLVRVGADINTNAAETEFHLSREMSVPGINASIQANAPLPENGRLFKDARFTLALDGGKAIPFVVTREEAAVNQSAADLITSINQALEASPLSGRIVSELTGEGALSFLRARGTEEDNPRLQLRIHPEIRGWVFVMLIAALIFCMVSVYSFLFLPRPASDIPVDYGAGFPLLTAIREYLKMKRLWAIIALLLFYRFGEGMLFYMSAPFYLDAMEDGGLGLSASTVAMLKTYTDIPWMTVGGILGGFIISKWGLHRTFFPLGLQLNLTTLGYVYLAWMQPTGSFTFLGDTFPTQLFLISSFESFSYGMGYSPFVFFAYAIANGPYKTSLLMISTCIAGIGFSFPGALAGFIQQAFGYVTVFSTALLTGLAALPLLFIVYLPGMEEQQQDRTDASS